MTAAERLIRAERHLEAALAELDEATPDLPSYAVDAGRLIAAEVRVARRRIGNVCKVLGAGTRRAP